MSKIILHNNGVTRTVNSIVTARIREGLDSEYTLSVTFTEDDAAYINDNTIAELNSQYFEVVSYDKDTDGDSPICSAEFEHVSYLLNSDTYTLDSFTFSGTPSGALAAILEGTPFSAGTVEPTQELSIIGGSGTRRNILVTAAALMGGEIEYSGYTINIRIHRGSVQPIDIMGTFNVTHMSVSRSVRDNLTTYNIDLGRKNTLSVGDNIRVKNTKLGIDTNTRIIAMEYNPYIDSDVDIEVGDYVPDIIDTYTAMEETALKSNESYNGVYINRINGLTVIRYDSGSQVAKAVLSGDEFAFYDGDDNKILYFDAVHKTYYFGGQIEADSIAFTSLDASTRNTISGAASAAYSAQSAAEAIANGTYDGGTFIDGKSIYSPNIYADLFTVQPVNNVSGGQSGFLLKAKYSNNLFDMLNIHYSLHGIAPAVVFESPSSAFAEWDFMSTYISGNVYFEGNVNFNGTVRGLPAPVWG